MEERKIKKIILAVILICSINSYGETFKYNDFDYIFKTKDKKEFIDGIGEIYIDSKMTSTELILKLDNENINMSIKLKEKSRLKMIEIMQKYLAWADVAERKEIKMDKYIDKIDNIKIEIERKIKKTEITRELKFILFYYDTEKYYLTIEFNEVQGKKAESIHFNREQVIELINKVNEDAVKDGIKLYEIQLN
jgi:outer membrane protein assembly factor BamE (lipoprotein component of BamABCDE complex)